MRQILSHVLIAALAVVVFYWISNSASESHNHIAIGLEQQDQLREVFTQAWQRSPTDEEFADLLNDRALEEMAYREAIGLDLGSVDVPVRRRMKDLLEEHVLSSITDTKPTEQRAATLSGSAQ